MSKVITPSVKAYLKIREITHTNDEWANILDLPYWDKHVSHWLMNNIHPHHSLKTWFDEEFCMNKILRGVPQVPDLETNIVSVFTCKNKIFAIASILIPTDETTEGNDSDTLLVFYGGENLGKVKDFFANDHNLEKLFSIKPL